MPPKTQSVTNIAFAGGGNYCTEVIEKSSQEYNTKEFNARIVAVADTDPEAPGIVLARKMGLITLNDYHDLYDPKYNIHLITILTPDQHVQEDILKTKPSDIRVLSYQAFELFWKSVAFEARKLRQRNEEVETILNGIQDFIVVINPDLEIIEVNDAFLKKMSYKPEQVIGNKCHKIFYNIDYKCTIDNRICPLNEVIRNKRPHQIIKTRIKDNGERRYVEVKTFPVWEKSGKISKFVEISRDITKEKLEEAEITRRLELMVEERTMQLQESHNKLLHQDKMASLGKLSASVVHEINNPITGILNFSMLIKKMIQEDSVKKNKDDHQPDEQIIQYLDLMETETRRISRIVSNLLAFSRQSKIELQQLSINLLIEKTLLLNSNLFKLNRIKVETKLDPSLPSIVGAGDQLQQVLMNFVSNAAEALLAVNGGLLSIETKHDIETKQIVVRIKDSGPGIPKEDFSKLFEPFYTTKKEGKGVGLGLSVVYGIIEEHGGAIHVNSKVGKGSTFKIILPLEHSLTQQSKNGGASGQC